MSNLAVINTINLSPLAKNALLEGASALERSIAWARTLPKLVGIVLLVGQEDALPEGAEEIGSLGQNNNPAFLRVLRKKKWDTTSLIEAFAELLVLPLEIFDGKKALEPLASLFYAWGDAPLLDEQLSKTLWDLHYKYDAEYTFSDGYPYGLAPEILAAGIIEKLHKLAKGSSQAIARDSLFELLRQDINAFDIETHLSPRDLRMERVFLTCDTQRNKNILERLYRAGAVDAATLCELIPQNRVLLRDLPAFFPIQVSSHCPQACSYCPFSQQGTDPRQGTDFMAKERFEDLCRRLLAFSSDAVISLSLWGEPASHPQIGELITAALGAGFVEKGRGPTRSRVLIETSGIGWQKDCIESLAREVEPGRLLWIVSLDARDPDLYKRLRGKGLEEAEETARLLVKKFGAFCWLQAVRMEENEEHLEDFYRAWKKAGAQVIIQKYDSHAAFLPERQPADLSPLERHPCWHIKRDFPILLDGTVPVCKEDLGRRAVLGNVFTDKIEDIWTAGEALHRQHVAGKYPSLCANCDEYYSFNF